ncbi:hypothetical protein [Sulfitobacter sp.]|uniref:hypothetical protein n=1 Tax=Sulfitobacter sp. TaxID=1903071 RepID=UPI003563909C
MFRSFLPYIGYPNGPLLDGPRRRRGYLADRSSWRNNWAHMPLLCPFKSPPVMGFF